MPHPRVPPKKTQSNRTPFLLGPGRHQASTDTECFMNSSKYAAIPVEFDEALIETLPASALPVDWTAEPPSPSTQIIGDRWMNEARSAVLKVPSAIIHAEPNNLLNPAHRTFKKIRRGKAMPFAFDPRRL